MPDKSSSMHDHKPNALQNPALESHEQKNHNSHGGHEDHGRVHGDHWDHLAHMVADFKKRFWISLAGCVLYSWGILLSSAMGAILMSMSTMIVAINARFLRLSK